jgi:hypothetical protein
MDDRGTNGEASGQFEIINQSIAEEISDSGK